MSRAIRIELFGVPRLRAQLGELEVKADTLAAALRQLEHLVPALAPTVVSDGILSAAYLVALNGLQLTTDGATALADGDVIVIVAAQAGG